MEELFLHILYQAQIVGMLIKHMSTLLSIFINKLGLRLQEVAA